MSKPQSKLKSRSARTFRVRDRAGRVVIVGTSKPNYVKVFNGKLRGMDERTLLEWRNYVAVNRSVNRRAEALGILGRALAAIGG